MSIAAARASSRSAARDRSTKAATAGCGKRRDRDDLGHAVDRLMGTGRDRPAVVLGDVHDGQAVPDPLAQTRRNDRVGARPRVPLDWAGWPDGRPRGPERDRRDGQDPGHVEFLGPDAADCHAVRWLRGGSAGAVMQQEWQLLDLEPRRAGGRRQRRRRLDDPFEGLRDAELTLPLADGGQVRADDVGVQPQAWARVERPHPGRDE